MFIFRYIHLGKTACFTFVFASIFLNLCSKVDARGLIVVHSAERELQTISVAADNKDEARDPQEDSNYFNWLPWYGNLSSLAIRGSNIANGGAVQYSDLNHSNIEFDLIAGSAVQVIHRLGSICISLSTFDTHFCVMQGPVQVELDVQLDVNTVSTLKYFAEPQAMLFLEGPFVQVGPGRNRLSFFLSRIQGLDENGNGNIPYGTVSLVLMPGEYRLYGATRVDIESTDVLSEYSVGYVFGNLRVTDDSGIVPKL